MNVDPSAVSPPETIPESNSGESPSPLGRYEILKDAIRDIVLVVRPADGKILDANEASVAAYGYSRDELLSLTVSDLRPPEARPPVLAQMAQAESGGVLFETVHMRRDGSTFPVEVSSRGTTFRGEPILVSAVRDISERRRFEDEQRRNLDLLRRTQEIARLGTYVLDMETERWSSSELLDQIFGIGPDYTRSVEGWAALIHPEDRAAMTEYFATRVLGEKEPFDREYRIVRAKDGEVRWVHGVGRLELDAEGRVAWMLGTIQDVTERRQAEIEVRRAGELFRAIFESAGDNIFLLRIHPDGPPTIVDVNRQGVRLHGYGDKTELVGKTVDILETDTPQKVHAERTTRLMEDGVLQLEVRHRRRDGTHVPLEVRATIIDIDGVPHAISVERDVSERLELEARLMQAQRMEAIGTLAGGIAHDFNNILTPILGHSELALMHIPDGNPAREDVALVVDAASRAKSLVTQILALSRKEDAADPVPVNVGALIKETAKFLRASIPATIDLAISVDQGCRPVLADPSRLHQVILNLCTNASQAMAGDGGTLTVSLRQIERDGASSRSQSVLMSVEDTGPGIPKELLGRIFDPYFTTKPAGKGSGLGLAVVREIVTALGGEIWVRSEPAKGAAFEVLLPTVDEPERLSPSAHRDVPRGEGQHLLVVDDEEGIRRVLTGIFQSLGYRVTTSPDGNAALAAYRASPEAFHAVITDYSMPGMNGVMLGKELRAMTPSLPIIVGTGFAESVDPAALARLGLQGPVLKPYRREQIAIAVAEALSHS